MNHKVRKPEGTQYDPQRAQQLLLLAEKSHAEYHRFEKNPDWKWEEEDFSFTANGKSYQILKRFGFGQIWLGRRRRVPFGFIAEVVDQSNQPQQPREIYVVFRGTMNQAEWISNAKVAQIKFRLKGKEFGEVHKGFHTIYTREDPGDDFIAGVIDPDPSNNLPPIKDVIEEILNDGVVSNDTKVFITGHSLGGALATLATLHIKQFRSNPPVLYAFANPRVGDSDFASHFNDIECYRIANSEDRVPNLPVASSILPLLVGSKSEFLNERLSWEHVGVPIYFTAQQGTVGANHELSGVYKDAV
jgi:triacylglycerol lipase